MALMLGGCTNTPAPVPTGGPTTGSPSPEPTETETPPPVLVPGGSASDNLPLFAAVVDDVWHTGDRSKGRAYIDALIAAGFARNDMQLTADRSTVGLAAETILFSVAWDSKECLIGQVGPSTGDPVTAVMPRLAFGNCIIGQTRPIDW